MSEHPAQTVTEIPDSLNKLSERVIGCAIEVHRVLGPGLLERLYEDALVHELQLQDLQVRRQVPVQLDYKGVMLTGQRLDLVVEHRLVIELKAVESVSDLHLAQLLSYLRVGNLPLGLLINFNVPLLKKGIHRRVNSAALRAQDSARSASSAPPLRPLRSI